MSNTKDVPVCIEKETIGLMKTFDGNQVVNILKLVKSDLKTKISRD